MRIRKSSVWLGSALLLVCSLGQPTRVGAQCSVITTSSPGMQTQAGMSATYVVKQLNGVFMCTATASTMVVIGGCVPGTAGGTTSFLSAFAYTTATNPACNWVCNCGTASPMAPFTIDGTDGLPVELMGFEVVDGEVEDDEDAEENADG